MIWRLALTKRVNKTGEGHRDWRKMELWEFADIVLALVDRAGLADAGMGDEEGIEVWE